MEIVIVNWTGTGTTGVGDALAAAAALPLGGHMTVMIHGYRFSPEVPAQSPHRHILSLTPRSDCWKAISWPRHLHLDRHNAAIGVAFGWPAIGRLGPVAARAFGAGDALADLLARVTAARPDVHINLLAHSLGARVALRALRQAPAHSVHRAILLAAAEYRPLAQDALNSPAGRTATVINSRSSENLPFDLAFRAAVPAPHLTALPLSAGLPGHPNWIDLSIDCAVTRAGLRDLGHTISPPVTRFCHWSGYLRPGLFPLYRRLLDPSDQHLIAYLRALSQPRARRHRGVRAQLSPL
jgi:pimeloyl-ACP methyl ester carboxylesterase